MLLTTRPRLRGACPERRPHAETNSQRSTEIFPLIVTVVITPATAGTEHDLVRSRRAICDVASRLLLVHRDPARLLANAPECSARPFNWHQLPSLRSRGQRTLERDLSRASPSCRRDARDARRWWISTAIVGAPSTRHSCEGLQERERNKASARFRMEGATKSRSPTSSNERCNDPVAPPSKNSTNASCRLELGLSEARWSCHQRYYRGSTSTPEHS